MVPPAPSACGDGFPVLAPNWNAAIARSISEGLIEEAYSRKLERR
jgi:hypothetical protein